MSNLTIEHSATRIDKLKDWFKKLVDTNEMNYVYMGEVLNEIKEEMQKNGDNFIQWLEQETRISYSTANRYMKIAEGYATDRYKEEWRRHVAILGVKKAYELLKIKDIEERYVFMKENNIKSKSYEVTKELLIEHLNKGNPSEKKVKNKKSLEQFEKVIDKEIKRCEEIISELDVDTHTIYHQIKEQLIELQELLVKARNYELETPEQINGYEL